MLFFSVLHNAVPSRSQESKNGDQHSEFVTRLLPLQHQRYDVAGNDNPCNATPETQFIRHDINQDKSNGQASSGTTGLFILSCQATAAAALSTETLS